MEGPCHLGGQTSRAGRHEAHVQGEGRLVAGAQSAVELCQELACGPALLTVALGVVSSTDWGENTAQGTRGRLNEET